MRHSLCGLAHLAGGTTGHGWTRVNNCLHALPGDYRGVLAPALTACCQPPPNAENSHTSGTPRSSAFPADSPDDQLGFEIRLQRKPQSS